MPKPILSSIQVSNQYVVPEAKPEEVGYKDTIMNHPSAMGKLKMDSFANLKPRTIEIKGGQKA